MTRRGSSKKTAPLCASSWVIAASKALLPAQAVTRLYGASRLFVNFFQPSFKLAEKQPPGRTRIQAVPSSADSLRTAAYRPRAFQRRPKSSCAR